MRRIPTNTSNHSLGLIGFLPSQDKVIFLSTSKTKAYSSSIVLAVEHACATLQLSLFFCLFPISFSVLFGFCVLNYIFDVATGQDPEMNNSATVYLSTIFIVQDSQAKAMLKFAPVRSSHRDVFSAPTNTCQFRP